MQQLSCWADLYWGLQQVPLNSRQMTALLHISMFDRSVSDTSNASSASEIERVRSESSGRFLFAVLESRLRSMYLRLSLPAMLFLESLATSPGDIVMMAVALRFKFKDHDAETEVSLDELVERAFSHGYPVKDDLSYAWEAQKVSTKQSFNSDNLLDIAPSVFHTREA